MLVDARVPDKHEGDGVKSERIEVPITSAAQIS